MQCLYTIIWKKQKQSKTKLEKKIKEIIKNKQKLMKQKER